MTKDENINLSVVAVMSALKGLQDKIRTLEHERSQAETNLKTLATETTRYRDILHNNDRSSETPQYLQNGDHSVQYSPHTSLLQQASQDSSPMSQHKHGKCTYTPYNPSPYGFTGTLHLPWFYRDPLLTIVLQGPPLTMVLQTHHLLWIYRDPPLTIILQGLITYHGFTGTHHLSWLTGTLHIPWLYKDPPHTMALQGPSTYHGFTGTLHIPWLYSLQQQSIQFYIYIYRGGWPAISS